MTVPCPHCSRRLRVRIDTDGMGGTVERVQRCDCSGARKERHECIDCGVPIERRVRKGPWPTRCPKHIAKRDRERARRSMVRCYQRDPDRYKRRARERWRRLRRDPVSIAEKRKVSRDRYRLEQKIRRGHLRRCPPDVKHLRDRLIYRLRENEGWSNREIAETLGIGRNYVATLYQRQRRFREQQERRVSA